MIAKFFSRINVLKSFVILFGLSIFSAVIPAELPEEEVRPVTEAQQARIKTIHISVDDRTNTWYWAHFNDTSGQEIEKTDAMATAPRDTEPNTEAVKLPIQNMTLVVASQKDVIYTRSFTAEEISRLRGFSIQEGGKVKLLWDKQPGPTKSVTIDVYAFGHYRVYFIDPQGNEIQKPVDIKTQRGSGLTNVEVVKLPIQNMTILFEGMGYGNDVQYKLDVSAADVARLNLLKIDWAHDRIMPRYAPPEPAFARVPPPMRPAVPVPVAPEPKKEPIPPVVAPIISEQTAAIIKQYHDMVTRGDIDGLLPKLSEIKAAGLIDAVDGQGMSALHHAVILYKGAVDIKEIAQLHHANIIYENALSLEKNALNIINALVENGASLFLTDNAGATPLDLAGDKKAILLQNITAKGECPICTETSPLVRLPCGHGLCKKCYEKIMAQPSAQRFCPMCRKPIE